MIAARRGRPPLALRVVTSVAVLAALGFTLDAGSVLSRLRGLRASGVLIAIAISVLQVGVSAWRWRFTAARLGLALPFRVALREYYLATFLNQVLPGGVAGDLSRAWRHAGSRMVGRDRKGSAIRGVVLERASGQAVMMLVAAASLFAVPLPVSAPSPVLLFGGGVGLVAVLSGPVLWVGGPTALPLPLRRLWTDARAAFLSRGALALQVAGSCVVVATYLAVYVVAARAVGVDAPLSSLLPLVAPILVAMLLPVSVAGWGVREGAAAAVWTAAGYPAAEGVAVSMTYGVLVLLSSAPGALVLVRTLGTSRGAAPPRDGRPCPPIEDAVASVTGDPDRRGRPLRGRSDDTADAAPRRASRPDPASAPDGPDR